MALPVSPPRGTGPLRSLGLLLGTVTSYGKSFGGCPEAHTPDDECGAGSAKQGLT